MLLKYSAYCKMVKIAIIANHEGNIVIVSYLRMSGDSS